MCVLRQINAAVTVPGLSHALVFDWNGDNAGPFSAQDYIDHMGMIRASFPNATVVASTVSGIQAVAWCVAA